MTDLGKALRELDAPEHDPAFAAQLHALLEQEAAGRRRSRRPRRWRLPAGLAVAAAAAACFVILAVGGGGTKLGPARANAAEIVARAEAAIARATSISAVRVEHFRYTARGRLRTVRERFSATDRGDFKLIGSTNGDLYYSSARARLTILHAPYGDGPQVLTGMPPGDPDASLGGRLLSLQTAAATRALAAAHNARVSETTRDGRPVYVLDTAVPVNKLGFSGDHLTVTVDRGSGFPLAVRETYRGRVVSEFRLKHLRLDAPIPASAFAPKTSARPVDSGFRTVALAMLRPPYTPLRVTLPDGFRDAETRVARTGSPTGDEALNPPSSDIVSTAYRRGLDTVVVSTRRTGPDPGAWNDPVPVGEGNPVDQERYRITSGALKGETARLVVSPRAVPHAWIVTRKLVVTVVGPLSRAELITAVNSLHR